jgi:hypothetical protein
MPRLLLLVLFLLAPPAAAAQDRWLTLLDHDGGRADLDLASAQTKGRLVSVSVRWFRGGSDSTWTVVRQDLDCHQLRARIRRVDHYARFGERDSLIASSPANPEWTVYEESSLEAEALRLTCHVAPGLAPPPPRGVRS